MNCREFMIQDLAYYNHRDLPGRTIAKKKCCSAGLNILKSVLLFIPIINTIFGIVMITVQELERKRRLRLGYTMPQQEHNRIPRIIALSLCIASLGILLLPLVIMGTMIKNGRQVPLLGVRDIKEIPPDYLL